MKRDMWRKLSLILAMLATPALLFAQTNPCGDDPFDPSPCDLPLDNYVLVLVIAFSLFAVWRLNKNKKNLATS